MKDGIYRYRYKTKIQTTKVLIGKDNKIEISDKICSCLYYSRNTALFKKTIE